MSVMGVGAPRRGLRFEVVDDAGIAAVMKILEGMQELGVAVRINDEPDVAAAALPSCAVCGHTTSEVRPHEQMGAEACLACWLIADRLIKRYTGAYIRQEREFYGQLRQMVQDVRSGADEPTFYRGLE